ncbi:MAG: hypothetical protein ACREC4_03700 [Methylocella sp.]
MNIVPLAQTRASILRRWRRLLAKQTQMRLDIDHWNAAHPEEEPVDTNLTPAIEEMTVAAGLKR